MMLRQSLFRWLILAGIMLFLAGLLLDSVLAKKGNVHLALQIPVNQLYFSTDKDPQDSIPFSLKYSIRADSISVQPFDPEYEIQLRVIDQQFSQAHHNNLNPPTILLKGFPLSPMKIQKVGDTPFRFRLKEFYPDFTFQYSYPDNRDTIPPRAPGITILLSTSGKEEVVTLRSDKPNLRKLDDVVGLGCTLEYDWEIAMDSLILVKQDSGKQVNRIVFAGKGKKIYWLFDGKLDSTSLENKFYSIPGKKGEGFTLLQSFPDARYLKALPATKSDQLRNPVAEVEVWKLGERSQSLFLYPNASGRHGGEWKVPDTRLVLTCSLSHDRIVAACHCRLLVNDSLHQAVISKEINGKGVFSYKGINLKLSACDVAGSWADFKVWTSPGYYLRLTGLVLGVVSLIGIWFPGLKKEVQLNQESKEGNQDQ